MKLMSNIRRIVLDVMKPFSPDVIEYSKKITELESVNSVNIALLETDREIENIKITLEGEDLNYENIKKRIEDLSGAIHSIDLVAAGKKMIKAEVTPQDS